MTDIDFGPYVRSPRLSAAGGVVLGIRLIKAAPDDLTAGARRALRALREATSRVQAVAQERDRLRPDSLRPLDQRLDGAWAGIHLRLQAWTRIGHADAHLAQKVLDAIFPTGLEFSLYDYEAEWVESDNRLARIVDEGLEPLIVRLAGLPFLTAVRGAHADFGEALGLGKDHVTIASPTGLAESMRLLGRAIGAYGRTLASEVDVEDEASVQRFLSAVSPLDEYRSRASGGKPIEPPPDADPNEPVPPG